MSDLKSKALTWYEKLRATVETEENVGKLLSIDVETGNYALGNDFTLDAPRSLREKTRTRKSTRSASATTLSTRSVAS
jgi:hypothetical protein